jgi:ATP-dependent Zn protease
MGKRFICEIKKDNNNNELELVNTNNYNTLNTSTKGAIKFSDNDEMNRYFNKHCISENQLQNDSNSLFMFLFFLLLIIFLVTIICQMFNKSSFDNAFTVGKTSFGRFSF